MLLEQGLLGGVHPSSSVHSSVPLPLQKGCHSHPHEMTGLIDRTMRVMVSQCELHIQAFRRSILLS